MATLRNSSQMFPIVEAWQQSAHRDPDRLRRYSVNKSVFQTCFVLLGVQIPGTGKHIHPSKHYLLQTLLHLYRLIHQQVQRQVWR